jgi:methylisocitrate lyase
MLEATTAPTTKRKTFRDGLSSGRLLRFPGALNPLVAILIEELGFEGVYGSGAVMSAELGLPDIGLLSLSEVAERSHQIARVTNLPVLVDAETGFGEPVNVARAIQRLEDVGVAGCHLEDQVNPKRCGHLENKAVVSTNEMVQRLSAAVTARRDDGFVICARTDCRDAEGLDALLERARSYVDAGADMIFPEALRNEAEFEAVRNAISVPILANMTEFGKSPILSTRTLSSLGVNVVIYPVTALRIAMGAIERGLHILLAEGSQEGLIAEMQTRDRLYELVDYEAYNTFDSTIFDFAHGTEGDQHG